MLKTKRILVLLLAFILVFGSAQELLAQGRGGVKGVLKDAQSGEPLMYANVALAGTTSVTVTDEEGSYAIVFSYISYKDVPANV